MLKGYRTYIAIVLAFVAEIVLPQIVVLNSDVTKALVGVLLAVAAYYRSQA